MGLEMISKISCSITFPEVEVMLQHVVSQVLLLALLEDRSDVFSLPALLLDAKIEQRL